MTRDDFIIYVEATQKAFRRFLVALCCGDGQRADDIAQEAYIKAYMASGKFKDTGKFKTWLYRIGYNTFIDSTRSRPLTEDLDTLNHLNSSDGADDAFNYQELYQALNQLNPGERNSILLHYLEGYSIKEIAEMTQKSIDAIKQHLSRGRVKLRHILKDE